MNVRLENILRRGGNHLAMSLGYLALYYLANKVASSIIYKLNVDILKKHDIANHKARYTLQDPETYQKNSKTENAIRLTFITTSLLAITAFVNTRGKDVSSMSFQQIFLTAPKFF